MSFLSRACGIIKKFINFLPCGNPPLTIKKNEGVFKKHALAEAGVRFLNRPNPRAPRRPFPRPRLQPLWHAERTHRYVSANVAKSDKFVSPKAAKGRERRWRILRQPSGHAFSTLPSIMCAFSVTVYPPGRRERQSRIHPKTCSLLMNLRLNVQSNMPVRVNCVDVGVVSNCRLAPLRLSGRQRHDVIDQMPGIFFMARKRILKRRHGATIQPGHQRAIDITSR